MDAYLGSLINRFYKVVTASIYIDKLPEGFKRPSMYFPRPDVNEVSGGLQFEFAEHLLKVTIFGSDLEEVYGNAKDIQKDILSTRKLIEFVDAEGNPLNEYFRVSNIQIRSNEIDATATLTMSYMVEETYGRADYVPVEYVNIASEVVDNV